MTDTLTSETVTSVCVTGARAAPVARVRLTVVSPARPAVAADVLVEAPAGTPVGTLLDDLALATDGITAAGLWVDGAPVPGTAVVGRPPLLDGAVVVAGGGRRPVAAPLLEVHVVAGPAAGERFALGPGVHLLGRGPDAAIRVDDPDVSRAHAAVAVAAGGVRVTDLGSTNGTTVDRGGGGGPGLDDPGGHDRAADGAGRDRVTRLVPEQDAAWPHGAALVAGGSRLVLRRPGDDPGGAPAATSQDGLGHLLVNRAPRVRPARTRRGVELPVPRPVSRPSRIPWPALVLPAVLAVPMALWWRQPVFLLLAVLSPVAMLGQHLFERRGARQADRRSATEHAAAAERARVDLAAAVAADLDDLDGEHPDLAVVAAAAAGPTRRLWERSAADADALVVRMGVGRVPARVDVSGPGACEVVHALGPVTLDLAGAGVVGLAGRRDGVLAAARAVVGQVCALHAPRDVHVVVLGSDATRRRDWSWARWLPHGRVVEALDHPGGAVGPSAVGAVGGPDAAAAPDCARAAWTLVVLDGAHTLRRDPGVAGLLATAREAADRATGRRATVASVGGTTSQRFVVLCLDDDETRLPAECGATVVLERRADIAGPTCSATAQVRVEGRVEQRCLPDGAGAAWASRLARDLARLRDATPRPADAGLPGTLRLADVVGLPSDDVARCAEALVARWRRAPGTPPPLRAVMGASAAGPWVVDLRRDGPHALVAGTTGAGKSELLRTLVASLAVEHPPHELNVLLVDYKGGTAFAGLAGLPQVCGLLTDLDAHLARRALASLHAELRRRERLLRAAGVGDLDGYDRLGPRTALPRLVVVVDEFRVLAEELPELLDGLVRVAALGRSLGVHLVLATQRPAGVVSADMRANLNLRLALRVRDRADSDDVVEAPDAARLPADRPGRALLRVGGGPLVTVQSALVSGGPARAPGRPRVTRLRDSADRSAGPTVRPAGTSRPEHRRAAVSDGAPDPL
ncbi:MAG: FtsK/SpoIIIE domain-containing protein, partial [Kineosporiaceae bacterium]